MKDKIQKFFASGGPLGLSLKGYEQRDEQVKMALDVTTAFENNTIALIEAGTGTGKSFAYLIPAILWAAKTGERVVVSTNTIALQQQLIDKDIPAVLNMLRVDVKVVLAMGMNNYLCLRKQNQDASLAEFQGKRLEELHAIYNWSKNTKTGARSELAFQPSKELWEKMGAEAESCSTQCSFYERCFFFRARRHVDDAKVIICNHHLLCAALAAKAKKADYTSSIVLPAFERLIIDEAHHIEEVASAHFTDKISRLELMKLLGRLGGVEKEEAKGPLAILANRVGYYLPKVSQQAKYLEPLALKLRQDLQGLKAVCHHQVLEFFSHVETFLSILPQTKQDEEKKWRIRERERNHEYWKEALTAAAHNLIASLKDLSLHMHLIEQNAAQVQIPAFQEETKSVRLDIIAIGTKAEEIAKRLHFFFQENVASTQVYWIEMTYRETCLFVAELEMAELLDMCLFSKMKTSVLCSATLTTQGSFKYVKSRVGIAKKPSIEAIYDSPFNFQRQSLLAIPTDMPAPDEPHFSEAVHTACAQCIRASRGGAFVLFTSYAALQACYNAICQDLLQQGLILFKQGEDHRHVLIKRFKESEGKGVLFGTDSFWEGVDVVGDALRCVIVVKLPFPVPTEPLAEARSELIRERGGNPFMEYSTPKAIVKFKQAFGRLIRHRDDRGCVVCLDIRLIKKGYGRLFLDSLPKCDRVFLPLGEMTKKMREFYSTTK